VNAAAVRATSHARWVPAIFGGTWPPILPGATLPVARSLCVHFTTLDGATLSASATFRTLSPAAIRATARSRKSIDRGLTIGHGRAGRHGSAEAINFQPTGGGKAAIAGDFVLTANEVNPVLRGLRDNGIEVTALHNHMLNDEPRLFFMHFWANDEVAKLAAGLRAALDKIDLARG
jgi:Domain of Unknown Function (DUF1259)